MSGVTKCHVIKLCTKFDRNGPIRSEVIDDWLNIFSPVLRHAVTLTFDPLPLNVRVSRNQTVCQKWAKSNNPRLGYWPISKFSHFFRTLKQISCVGMIAVCSRQVWWSWVHALVRTVGQKYPTPKIARRKRAKSSITQRWISWFRSNFVQSLNAWHPIECYKSLRSRGQKSRSQRDITHQHQKTLWFRHGYVIVVIGVARILFGVHSFLQKSWRPFLVVALKTHAQTA